MSGRFNKRRNFKNQKGWQKKLTRDFVHNKPKEYRHTEQLSEPETGITEYLSDFEGFSGILKSRFSDFQVNEIDLDGNVAKLTDTNIPKDFRSKEAKVDYKTISETPIEAIPQQTWEDIKSLMDSEESKSVQLNADNLEKDQRKIIHECIKKHFGAKLVAQTITVDDKKILEFKKSTKENAERRSEEWPADKGEYVHFILYKECIDTLDACMKISDCIRTNCQIFNYAGVKDKRAKTTQWVSVRKVEPWKLIIKTKPLKNIKIGNITFKDHPLKLGDLSGNKFRIALRNVTADNDLINKSLQFVKDNGLINYYGLQRFGNDKEVPTFDIGVKLMQGKWEEATKLILKPKKSDDPSLDISKAKLIYRESGDAKKAFEALSCSKNTCIEAKLLEGLSKTGENEYVNALEKIPRNMRLLYIHSFQSLIWNKMVSKRIKEFGLKPVVGDFVVIGEKTIKSDSDTDSEDILCKQEIKVLKEDELGQYTIFDIVLPLPGYDISYPDFMKDYYKEALAEYDLTLEMPKQKVKTYTLSGTYRNILMSVNDLSWKTLNYKEQNDNLILSDFEQLKGQQEPVNVEGGKFKALVMEFSLCSSSYATMVIREIMKIDTSTSTHAKMNNYATENNQKKISLDVSENIKSEPKEIMQESSLIADKAKYEEFKRNIFNVTSPVKRPSDEDKSVPNKKLKVEEKESGIKMEASLV